MDQEEKLGRVKEHMVHIVFYFGKGAPPYSSVFWGQSKKCFGSNNDKLGTDAVRADWSWGPSQFPRRALDGATGSSSKWKDTSVLAGVTPTMFGNAKRTTTGLDFTVLA